MADLNKVFENGRLTRDPELRGTTNGTSVVRFSIAVTRYDGKTDFFDCKAWRGTAEFLCRNFRKGDGILIEGHLEKSTYTAHTKSGEAYEKTDVEIVAETVNFAVGTKSRTDGNLHDTAENAPQSGYFTAQEAANNFVQPQGAALFEDVQDDDNLPF